jgi:hypothetical protein
VNMLYTWSVLALTSDYFLNVHVYLYVCGKSRKFPKLSHPNNHTSVNSKGVDLQGILRSVCEESCKKLRFATVLQVPME